MSHHTIDVRNVRHVYDDGTVALRGVSFRIVHGETVAIVGANGAGKSTLLLHLNGHLAPTSGEVSIGDTPVTRRTLPTIRHSVGLVLQDADDQLFMPTVFEDVAFGPRNQGLAEPDVERRVRAALDRVGLWDTRAKAPYRLSAGEKKRAAIAGVIAMSPSILVLDEPSSGLDPFSRRQLIGLLSEFHHTKIITTHDLELVVDLCPRTIILDSGTVLADGPTLILFEDASLMARAKLECPASLLRCAYCATTPLREGTRR